MVTDHLVPLDISGLYEVHEWRNAVGILSTACPQEWTDIQAALRAFRLMRSEVIAPGNNRSDIVARLEVPLKVAGWVEKQFATSIVVDNETRESPTHSVDCFKGRVALEVEWNNKDPFYDRDLNNFRLLFDLQVIDVGVIITRCSELQRIFNLLDKGSSYGNSTTHMGKLLPRLRGGSGGGCPIVAFGISTALYIED
jgi:hypothetical protein